jgi:hypothetical protein
MITKMKTFFIFLLGSLLTVTAFAADRRPTVTISGSRDYQIVIDGRRVINNNGNYNSNYMQLNGLRNGRHTMEVYEMRRGLFGFGGNSRRISASEFTLWNNDLNINIDRFGSVRVYESGYGRDNGYGRNNGRYNDHDEDDQGYGRDNGGWGRNRDDNNRNRDWNNGNNHGQYPRY